MMLLAACGISERLRLDLVLNDFVAGSVASGAVNILSDGTSWRPLINVSDMARAVDWAIVRDMADGGPFLAINTGSDEWNYQVIDLAFAVAEVFPGLEIYINNEAQHVSGCTTILEAAAMRRPVVISDVPGIREYVVDGVTGIIVPVNDEEAFRNAVRKLMSDNEYGRTIGENAYNYVRDRFTSENFAKAHLELTKEILDRGCRA